MKTRNELTAIRKAAGYTQKQLAEKAAVCLSVVIKWEKGTNVRPSSDKAIREAIMAIYHETPTLMF